MHTNQWGQEALKVHIKFSCGHEYTILSPGVADPAGIYTAYPPLPGFPEDERNIISFNKCWECRGTNLQANK